jgi:hypothetical protein
MNNLMTNFQVVENGFTFLHRGLQFTVTEKDNWIYVVAQYAGRTVGEFGQSKENGIDRAIEICLSNAEGFILELYSVFAKAQ